MNVVQEEHFVTVVKTRYICELNYRALQYCETSTVQCIGEAIPQILISQHIRYNETQLLSLDSIDQYDIIF